MKLRRRSFSGTTPRSFPPTTTRTRRPSTVPDVFISIGSLAPKLEADAFARGEERRRLTLGDFRGNWTVVAFGVRRFDALELADLEEAFAADGAVVLATTHNDWHETESLYRNTPVRFPLLTEVEETRRMTMIVDPSGVVRHVGLRRTARETLQSLERLLGASTIRSAA
jgi:alkyl hydroperoxide reductase subunit AhpC